MTSLIHIADRVLNRPLLITRDKAQVILSVLGNRIGVSTPEANRFEGQSVVVDADGKPKDRPYKINANGIGIVTITGSLVNRGAYVGASSGLTSYEGIAHQLKSVMSDDQVRSVILDLHSPGGEAVGAFETAELVRQLSAKKHTVAIVNGMAASAAYAIASGASEIVTTETGVSGSIGVVLLHADYSRALANEGIEPTLIFAGAHKVDGNPFEPLSADVRNDLQDEVNAFYESFLKTVSKGRGSRLTANAARKTEARTFIGQGAVDAGIVDRVGSFESVLLDLSRASGRSTTSQPRRKSMSENNGGAPAAEENAGIPQATHDAAVNSARSEGEASGNAAGAKAASDKFAAIVSADGIKGNASRIAAAIDLAVKSPGMSAEDVTAFVTANVTATPTSSAASLANRTSANSGADALGASDQPEAKGGGRLLAIANKRYGG